MMVVVLEQIDTNNCGHVETLTEHLKLGTRTHMIEVPSVTSDTFATLLLLSSSSSRREKMEKSRCGEN